MSGAAAYKSGMRIPSILAVTCAMTLLLSGCSNDRQGASTSPPTPKQTAEATECGAERLGGFVNKQATPEVLSQIQQTVGHDSIRVLDPKSVVTMDFQSDRLNVDTDAGGRILRLRCG